MKNFPDESRMEKSDISGDPIRGGSIGLNRVLGRFVEKSSKDHKPEFTAVLLSAFTIFRNVWSMKNDASMTEMENGFVTDVNLFLDYYDTYLSHIRNSLTRDKTAPVIIYFPDYKRLEKELRREPTGKRSDLIEKYGRFLSRYNGRDELVKKMENVQCFWIRAGDATYPHKEVARKFREIVSHRDSLYSAGDSVALMSHIPLDYHISHRLRGIHLLESYTGELKGSDQFRFRIDKDGRVPFNTVCHVVFGDNPLIKPMVTPKIRKLLLEQAVKERWVSRSEDDLRTRISKTANIPIKDLKKYDFG